MRLIITGSSGQIGTNLALGLLEHGHEVVGFDCRPNPWTRAFPSALVDLREPLREPPSGSDQCGAFERAEVVVHLAAHAKVHELVELPQRAFENVAMTQHALEFCRQRRLPLVLASSREVYGDVHRECASEADAQFDQVTSTYAASKVAGETMVHAYARSYGLRYLIFRLSNVYGRYDDDLLRLQRVVPLFIRRIGEGRAVTVFGADKVIDFTYIDECVDGIVRGIERLRRGDLSNETINLASGKGRSLLDLVAAIGSVLGRQPTVAIAAKRPGEVTRYVANLDKARALLGFDPTIELEEGIRRAVAWQQEARSSRAPLQEHSGALVL